ncbi:MAG: QueT transporter family protein [Eubacteriaceae bacterium]|nr:QueT transporter family protein [Eubacteriaceae bacterium]
MLKFFKKRSTFLENKNTVILNKKASSKVRKLTISAVVIALYVVIMFFTQSFAFGQFQIRIATSIYSLAAIYPFLIIPMGIANLFSNTLMGGLGPFDIVGGFIVGIITAGCCYYLKKINVVLVAIPILVIPSLLVPIWLSYLIQVPYSILVVSIGIGQILPSILGIFIVKYLEVPLSKI